MCLLKIFLQLFSFEESWREEEGTVSCLPNKNIFTVYRVYVYENQRSPGTNYTWGYRLAPGATHREPIFSPNNLPGGIPAILLVKKNTFLF